MSGPMSPSGPFEKCRNFRYLDAIGGEADLRPGRREVRILTLGV